MTRARRAKGPAQRATLPPWRTAQLSLFANRRETCERCQAVLALNNSSGICSACRDGERLDREQDAKRDR